MNVDGTGYTVLHTLPGTSGTTSNGGLIQTTDGAIWGTTMFGGTLAHGLIFRIAPTGAVSVVHEFPGGAGGMRPGSELVAASDGFLYGTTIGDQTTSRGTVYRVDSLGTVATLHTFTGPDGSTPFGGLAEGPDGALYGMTNGGGTLSRGVLFKVAGGVVTKVLDLSSTTGGAPRGSLARSRDGRLYGITQSGGAFNSGTLVRLNVATGQLRVLLDLPAGTISQERLFEPTYQNALIGVEVFGPKRGGAILRFMPDRPPAGSPDTFTTAEDTPLSIAAPGVLGNDTDEEPSLTAALVVPPPVNHGTVVLNANGSFTFTPAPNFHGPTSFTYTAADALDTSDPVTVTIDVTPVNDAPTVANASVSTDEDTPAAGVVGWIDVDDAAVTFRIDANGTRGIPTIDANSGAFTYTPNPNAHGPDSFTVIANDGDVDSTAATITVAITPVNDAPLAAPQSVTTAEDVSKLVALGGTDVDGDPLTFVVLAQPLKGTVTLSGNAATYMPLSNFHGSDSFTFSVSDGQLSSAAPVTITVTQSNDAPVAATQTVSTVEDTPVAITLWGSDLDGDPVTFAIVSGPSHGALAGTAPNVTYTPAENYRGADSFMFKVNDGTIDSPVATVTITVTGEQFVRVSPDAGGIAQTIAVSAVSSAVVYAGTARGFYRSTDSGASWTRASFGSHFSSIAIHPTTPTTLFAAGNQVVWRSTDGGANWVSLGGPGIALGVVIDPSNPQTLYTRAFSQFALMKSTDGGATWAPRTTGMVVRPGDQLTVSTLAVDPSNPSRLFAGLSGPNGLFRTTDGATSWQASGLAGMSVSMVVVDAHAPSSVYAIANGRLHRSVDGGTNWVDINAGISGFASLMTVEPATGVVYAAVANVGIFVSANQGASWTRFDVPQTGALVSLVSDPAARREAVSGDATRGVQEHQWCADLVSYRRGDDDADRSRDGRQPRRCQRAVRGDRRWRVQDRKCRRFLGSFIRRSVLSIPTGVTGPGSTDLEHLLSGDRQRARRVPND